MITDHSTSASSCSVWCMISCTFPLALIITKSVLCILYMVEYDSIVLKNWFSSPGFPSNVSMLSSTSFGMSDLYHVIVVFGAVAISDMLGSYSVIHSSFVYVDVPMVLQPMEMVELVSGSFCSLCGVRNLPYHFSHISLCLALFFALISPSWLYFHCLTSSSLFILELITSLAVFIVSALFSTYSKSDNFVSLVIVF